MPVSDSQFEVPVLDSQLGVADSRQPEPVRGLWSVVLDWRRVPVSPVVVPDPTFRILDPQFGVPNLRHLRIRVSVLRPQRDPLGS